MGDVLPAKELCRLARERDVMTMVDGACTVGLLDLDLSDIQPDFYSGSAHKWPCGPKEVGALYVNARAQARGIRFSPHIYNTMAEVDRAVAAIAKYMRQGV